MASLAIIAWPIAKLLDCMLGEGHTTFYRRAELKALVTLHAGEGKDEADGTTDHEEDDAPEKLTIDEVLIIKVRLRLGEYNFAGF